MTTLSTTKMCRTDCGGMMSQDAAELLMIHREDWVRFLAFEDELQDIGSDSGAAVETSE